MPDFNTVILAGRLSQEPESRYTTSGTPITEFSIAVNRKSSEKTETLFASCICFGKTAELVERYLGKGRLVGITGRIKTGSYEKDGKKIYTTDVQADRVEFLDKAPEGGQNAQGAAAPASQGAPADNIPEGFTQLTDDDIPF